MASDAHDALNSLYDVLNVEAAPDVNAEAILTWLQELGCRNEGVCVEPSRCFDGGLGVFATRAFASGDAILRVPLVAVLRRASLPADIGAWAADRRAAAARGRGAAARAAAAPAREH